MAVSEAELAGVAFFAGLDQDCLRFLASCAQRIELDKNIVLFRYGEPAEHFYLICRGRVTVEVPAISGPSLELQNLGPGEILGWSWLIPPYRWSFQARTVEPAELIEFDGAAVRARCESDPRFGYALLKRFSALMSERLNLAREKMIEEWNPPGFA